MKYIAILILLICSCSKSITNDDLSHNLLKWSSQKVVNYEFTLRINCFCPEERVGPHLIKGAYGKIISVNNWPYDITNTRQLRTIDEIFAYINTSLDITPYTKSIGYN